MTSYTNILNLLKKNPVTDGNDTFNIETMLNDNWDKIDDWAENKAKIQTGTYTGTGLYGQANKNELTFDFVPQIVFIEGFSTYNTRLILINPQSIAENETAGNTSTTYNATSNVAWNGNSVNWYSTKAYAQLNYNNVVYRYVAIG